MAFKVTISGYVAAACCTMFLAFLPGIASAASAVQKECSAKYQAAKSGGTLNGMTYNQYYKECAAEARGEKAGGAPVATTPTTSTPTTSTPTTSTPTTSAPTTSAPTTSAPATTTSAAPPARSAPAPVASGNAVFPTALSAQFSKESPGKARMHTCLAQYNANKANNGTGNGGLKWIMRGGGYYSECNKRLKT